MAALYLMHCIWSFFPGPSRSSSKPSPASATRKKLDRAAVQQLIAELLAQGAPDEPNLYEKGRITKPRKAWVKSVAEVADGSQLDDPLTLNGFSRGTSKRLKSARLRVTTVS